MSQRKIAGCAIRRHSTEQVWSVAGPSCHNDVEDLMRKEGVVFRLEDEKGFVCDDGSWVRRKPAAIIAIRAGQAKEERVVMSFGLLSSDVWPQF
jgi:hypothetical protein